MKVLVMGLGSIARKHIEALRKIDKDVEILALRSSKNSKPYPEVRDIYSIEEAEGENVEFVIISTPTACHEESIYQALRLKVPLFIEKPLLHTGETDRLKESVLDSKVLNYVACNLRFLDALQFVKREVETGRRINEVNVYCGSYLPGWRPGVDFRKVYSALPDMGGGVHIDLIHEIDYLYWMFGMPEEVSAVLRNSSSLDIPAIDYANYCLVYRDFAASVVLNYYRRDYRRTMEIVWEDETWLVDIAANRIICGDIVIFESPQMIPDTYERQMRYFLSLLKSPGAKSFNTIADACSTLDIALGGNRG